MKLLVTGGAGYIGGVAAAQLLAAGHQVSVLDDLSTGHADGVPDGASFVQGSLLDPARLAAAVGEGFDGVASGRREHVQVYGTDYPTADGTAH